LSPSAAADLSKKSGAAMRCAAFTAWLQGAGNRKTRGDFCRHYGLIERETAPVREKTPEELFAWAG